MPTNSENVLIGRRCCSAGASPAFVRRQARRLPYFESNQPAFERALEDGLAQARGAFERAFDFGFGLGDVGELGFDLGDDFGLLFLGGKRNSKSC